jgi:hypothetical protein
MSPVPKLERFDAGGLPRLRDDSGRLGAGLEGRRGRAGAFAVAATATLGDGVVGWGVTVPSVATLVGTVTVEDAADGPEADGGG